MILDGHQVARCKVPADSAGRIRREQRSRAECMHHPHGIRRERGGMSFVHVEAAGQRNHSLSLELSRDELARMSHDTRGGKARDVSERDARRLLDLVSEPAKTGAKDDRDCGCAISRSGSHDIGSRSRFNRPGLASHATSTIRSVISLVTWSMSWVLSSHRMKALSNPLRAIVQSSSIVKSR